MTSSPADQIAAITVFIAIMVTVCGMTYSAMAQQRARDIFDRTFANPLPGYRTALVISQEADQREAMLARDWN